MFTSETLPYITEKKNSKPTTRAKSMINYKDVAIRQSVTSYKPHRNSNVDIQFNY
jgi:hypothetical protein